MLLGTDLSGQRYPARQATVSFINGVFVEQEQLYYATFKLDGNIHSIVTFHNSFAGAFPGRADPVRDHYIYFDGKDVYHDTTIEPPLLDPEPLSNSEIGAVHGLSPYWVKAPENQAVRVRLLYRDYAIELGNQRNAIHTPGGVFALQRQNPEHFHFTFALDWSTVSIEPVR